MTQYAFIRRTAEQLGEQNLNLIKGDVFKFLAAPHEKFDFIFADPPYDLPNLQIGALFIVPSGLDSANGRVFKVINMESIAVYPATILCEIAPVYQDAFDRGQFDHTDNDTNLLLDTKQDNNGSDFMLLKDDDREDKLK